MTIRLSDQLAEQLQRIAADQRRDVDALVEEAVRDYLVWTATTDVDSTAVGRTQMTLAAELRDPGTWGDTEARDGDETR